MESIISAVITAVITGGVTLVGVILSNGSKTAVIENRLDNLCEQVNKHNQVIERTFKLEAAVTELQHDISRLESDNK